MTGKTAQFPILGVHSLDHFAIAVPDLDEARKFYEAFGLIVRQDGDRLGLYTEGHNHRWGVIQKGPKKKLSHVSFGAFEQDLPRFKAHFDRLGIKQVAPPDHAESNGIWIHTPDKVPFEIRAADKSSPDEKSAFAPPVSVKAGVAGCYGRSKAPRVKPRRLSHVAIFTTDVLRMIDFTHDVLGLRLSDHSGGIVAFMHGPHGSDHHMLALIGSDAPGFHHCSWDVASIEEVGLGKTQMATHGYAAGWGVGRHVLGANYFNYVRDPWGSYAEYSADIDYIPAGFDWPAADHHPEDSLSLWGPALPDDFVKNYEAA